MTFYRPSSQKRLRKFFKKKGFTIEEGGKHAKAVHPTGKVIGFPRHNDISNGMTKQICNDLVELGFDKAEVEQEILK